MPHDVRDIKSQIVIDERFEEVIKNLKGIKLPTTPSFDAFQSPDYTPEGKVRRLEHLCTHPLNLDRGVEFSKRDDRVICAYDESIASYKALEGDAICTSHSLIYVDKEDYIPTTYVTLRFFTRSGLIESKMGKSAVKTENIPYESAVLTARDKIEFLNKNCVDDSILLIDGALIAGDAYTTVMSYIEKLNDRNIVPAFFVKNSASNMVVDNYDSLKGQYNSDMHWSNSILKEGQRTDYFEYTDARNERNAKVFCYVKFYKDTSPVRLEFPKVTFTKFRSLIDDLVDLSFYLLIVQGDKKNPQLRPIAIAEKYARETLKVIDVNREIRRAGLVPTMNENRWGS